MGRDEDHYVGQEYGIFRELTEFNRGISRPPEDETWLTSQGVTELVTMLPGNELLPGTDRASIIHYTTQVRENKKYRYEPAGDTRGGNYLSFCVVLTHAKAQELYAATKDDPNVIRELAARMVLSKEATVFNESGVGGLVYGDIIPGGEEKWRESYCPPYKEWEETNGGVSRIAFRDGSDVPVEKSDIVTFQV